MEGKLTTDGIINSLGSKGVRGSRKKVVIVDDNASYLSIVRTLLKPFYDTYPAPSGEKLLQIMENFIPDMILLDIEMPEMSGFETINIIKENPRFKDVPIVFITAKDDEYSAVKGLSLGAVDYVTKPFSGPLLLRRISNLLMVEQLKRELQESQAEVKQLRAELDSRDL